MSEEQKESSVLFSLNELFDLEKERIRQEEDDKKRRADEEARAEEDARRRALEEEQARIRAEEERKRLDEQRRREEAARLEALRQAEIEKAKVEAEEQARLEAMRAQQAHAAELAKLKHDKGKKKLIIGIAVAAAIFIIGVPTAGYLWYQSDQKAKAEKLMAEQKARAKEKEMKRLKAQMEEQDKKIQNLINNLSAAKDAEQRAKLEAQIKQAQADKNRIAGALHGGGGKAAGAGKPKPKKVCPPGDPLCGSL